MNQQTGRMPNRLGLGINVFNALKVHPAILERVKYGGSTANPASVTENVLAQLFGVEKIVVLKSIMNNASMGEDENIRTHSFLPMPQMHRALTSRLPATPSHGICLEMDRYFRF